MTPYPPPPGPRLDERGPRAFSAPVDWSAWQARVRAVAGPPPAPRRAPGIVLGVIVTLGVLGATVGGVVFAGRSTGAAEAAPARPVTDAAKGPEVADTPLPLVGVSPLPTTTTTTTTTPPEPVPPPPPPASRTTAPVARIDADFVDATRPAVPRGDAAAAGGRLLRTVIRFPDAPGGGPFPLVVFAHGFAASTAAYAVLLDDLAAAGYVVAAPELPVTSTAYGDDVGDREPDAQVADVSFVISSVLGLAAGDSPLHGVVRDGPVAVIGHSDGGITAAAAAFASRVRDARVAAAVVLSGARDDFGGTWFPAGGPALLAVHGDADMVNPFASSQTLYASDRSGSPRYLVRVRGGGHTDAFLSDRTRPALLVLIDDFLRASLGTDPDAGARVATDAWVPGLLDLLGS
jgi:fermentation-respiration switch protein FrsA (DUF1100 family)